MLGIVFVLAIVATGVSAGGSWATFCDDNACQLNCGEAVSVDNPGCLNESGRGGVYFHGLNYGQVTLIVSPAPDCPCQSDCTGGIFGFDGFGTYSDNWGCYDLTPYSYAQSYRFIGLDPSHGDYDPKCPANNCPSNSNQPDGTPPSGSSNEPDGAPASGGSYQPSPPGASDPGSGGNSQPASGGSYQPASGGNSQPVSGGNSQPASGGNSQPASGGSYQPASGGSYQPASGGNSQPASGGNSQPASGGNSQPDGTSASGGSSGY